MNKRVLLGVAAGVLAAGAIGASAASLGGITGSSVGADTVVTAACDTNGIGVGYTTAYSASVGAYQISGVNLTGVDPACNSLKYALTVADAANVSLAQATGTLTVTANAATITFTPVAANSVGRLALVISG